MNDRPTPAVLAIGETMALVLPTGGSLEQATEFTIDIGGAESNLASHLAAHGIPAAWASAVGDDPLGRRMLRTLQLRDVDTSWVIVDPGAPTGLFVKDFGSEGTRVTYYRRDSAASRLDASFASRLPLATTPIVHLSGITPALSESCARLVDEIIDVRDTVRRPVSFDVNYRPALWESRERAASVLLALARRCSLVFVGRDEAESLWGTSTADDVRELIGPGNTLIVKDGAIAAHAYEGDSVVTAIPEPVEVVEAVGAGDAFAAGYLAAVLERRDTFAALENGHRRAARVLATTGDY